EFVLQINRRLEMQKIFKWTTAFIITVFAIWAFNSNSFAESSNKTYVDGEYDVTANALEAKKDTPSVAADYINEDAKVTVKDGELELTVTVPKNDQFELYEMYKNGEEQIKTEDDDNIYYRYNLNDEDVENDMIHVEIGR